MTEQLQGNINADDEYEDEEEEEEEEVLSPDEMMPNNTNMRS